MSGEICRESKSLLLAMNNHQDICASMYNDESSFKASVKTATMPAWALSGFLARVRSAIKAVNPFSRNKNIHRAAMSTVDLGESSAMQSRPVSPVKSTKSEDDVGLQQNEENSREKDDVDTENGGHEVDDKPFSVFTHNEKRVIVICAGVCSFFSPISGQIYFPSLDAIATDLHVMQGIAPAFVGGFSDSSGRRITYLICFIIYVAANIGLALQNDYAALMVLRCMQAAGGSGTVALATAVVSDVVTSQERGVYVSYMSVALQAGPALGPIIGGLLGQYLGWHSVFWFLLICTVVIAIPVAIIMPETCRNVVGDGSIPSSKWNRSYLTRKVERRLINEGNPLDHDRKAELTKARKLRFPNPFETVKIVFTREAGYALGYVGIVCCGFYATAALIPSQFGRVYSFNQIQIALCYLPLGMGSTIAAFVRGKIIDSRYRHHAKRLGLPLIYNRRVDLSNFPIERARLEVAIPTVALGTACVIGFGWMIQYQINLAGPLIFLFVIGFCISASLNTVSVLLVDLYPGKAGTATAANNLVRCFLGAGATSGVIPLIEKDPQSVLGKSRSKEAAIVLGTTSPATEITHDHRPRIMPLKLLNHNGRHGPWVWYEFCDVDTPITSNALTSQLVVVKLREPGVHEAQSTPGSIATVAFTAACEPPGSRLLVLDRTYSYCSYVSQSVDLFPVLPQRNMEPSVSIWTSFVEPKANTSSATHRLRAEGEPEFDHWLNHHASSSAPSSSWKEWARLACRARGTLSKGPFFSVQVAIHLRSSEDPASCRLWRLLSLRSGRSSKRRYMEGK
nr:itaconate transport protein [Quercus suber]